jgi:O-methyltransferase involved in polyketide biosynthesis
LHAALVPLNETYGRVTGRPGLDAMLLARHRAIDHLLEDGITSGRVEQVVEIAAGLSARGCRFARRFPGLRYVETDLPDMAAHKRRTLDQAGLRGARHEVCTLDALADDGPTGLAAVAADLDTSRGLAIVTEGLLSYLDRDDVLALWRRIATTLDEFAYGTYLSDLHLADDVRGMWFAEAFRLGLELFARGPVRYHFDSADETTLALADAGFRDSTVYRPADVVPDVGHRHVIRVLEATT